MAHRELAYLGPAGTFSHLVARKRFGAAGTRLVPCPSIKAVFSRVAASRARLGLVPIENSSGGIIEETVDFLSAPGCPLRIQEELQLRVELALLGRQGEKVRVVYSHFAPLQHCKKWLDRHLPHAERREVASTAAAAQAAGGEPGAVALAARNAAALYDLHVLAFPVEQDVVNLTSFAVIGRPGRLPPGSTRTSYIVELLDRVGALCSFLEPFRDAGVNLTRIVSRPVIGKPGRYLFLIDIQGTEAEPRVRVALGRAKAVCACLRNLGSYPVRRPYAC
jgi:chorismate mutase/prephenate dehydratase